MMNAMSQVPFFIVGCGRSGTSLLRNLLNSHPDVAIPLESLFIVDYLRAEGLHDLAALQELLLGEPEISEWGLKLKQQDFNGASTLSATIDHLHMLYAQSKGKKRWGQKTPRFVRNLDLIGASFPEAKFIHMIRDPRAVVNSLIRSHVHRSNPYHGALRWKMDVSAGRDYESRHPDRILSIKYENLVTHSEDVLKNISSFLNLVYQPDLLVHKGGTEEYSAFYEKIHQNLDRPLTTRRIDIWKTELSTSAVQVIEAIAMDVMVELGYEPVSENPALQGSFVFRMKVKRLFAIMLQAIRYFRYRRSYLPYLFYRKWKLGLLRDFLWTVNY
jgi:hypothetical protein